MGGCRTLSRRDSALSRVSLPLSFAERFTPQPLASSGFAYVALRRITEHHMKVSPGGVSSNLRAWEPYPLYFDRAEGARIWDIDNHEYLACAAAQGVLLVGHRNPIVIDAVRQQLQRITVVGASHPWELELCELILKRYPCHEQVRLTNSGSEAVLHAVRLARAATGREKILKVEGTYHGNFDDLMVSFTPDISEAGPFSTPNHSG